MKKGALLGLLFASFAFINAAMPSSAQAAPASKIKKIQKKVKRAGLVALPDTAGVLKAKSRTAGSSDVSGTPPPLIEFPSSDIKNLFWRPGVVDAIAAGSATQEQCNEFYSGQTDGSSGGFGACMMSENVGRAFQNLYEGGTSLCYMKNFPSAANLEAGGVTVDSGELPGGDITKIFAPPSGNAARLVRVHVTGFEGDGPSEEDVNIRVLPANENFLYRVELWFCGQDGIRGRDRITIKSDGSFLAINENKGGGEQGAFSSRIQAALTFKDGQPAFDTSVPRRMLSKYRDNNGGFKSQIVIKNNLIETRTLDSFGSGSRKSNMITRFSGDSPSEIRFLEGAFVAAQDQGGDFEGATEYRDSFYAAAAESALSQQLDSTDEVANDDFFEEMPEDDYDLSKFSCDAEADIELSLDMSNSTLQQAVQQCEQRPFDGMHFCFEDADVRAADENYFPTCIGGDGPA